jgi:hypothetical protein
MPAAPKRTIADRALQMAFRAWLGTVEPSIWERFHPDWRDSLQAAWEDEKEVETVTSTVEGMLGQAHAAEARSDILRVHPSWWVRALKDESPSVQRAVAASVAPDLRTILRHGLDLDPADLVVDHPPDPDALRWTLGLWTERIVGDLAEWPDDPPVIVALACCGFREVVDLAQAIGLAKLALSSVTPPPLRTRAEARFEAFQARWGEADAASRTQARRDLEPFLPGRRWARLGLVTFGRLLAFAEPYRTRWALQHLPYGVARVIRRSIKDCGGKMAAWEAEILRIARERLIVEGRLRERNDGRRPG